MRAFFLLLTLCLPSFAQIILPAAKPKLQVIIISISNFDDSAHYVSPVLQQGIVDSTLALTTFFKSHFPNAMITVKETPEQTTSDALSRFFRNDFHDIVDGNVTVLFVLSHGEYVPFSNPIYGNDLYVVTKDTDGTSTTTIRKSALSLTTELLSKTAGLKDGSILLAFIDTCHAGAARSIGMNLQALNVDLAGMKMMLMGASMSDKLSFQASFSRALVDLWQSEETAGKVCTSPEQSQHLLHDQIKNSLAAKHIELALDDGYPTVLVHYHGSLCLENFAAARSLILVQNTSSDALVARFTDKAGVVPPYDEPIEQHDYSLIALPRGKYGLDFYVSSVMKEHYDIDLSENWDYENFGTPSATELGQALASAAQKIDAAGFSTDTSTAFRQRAFAAFVSGRDDVGAAKMAALLPPVSPVTPSASGTYDALLWDAKSLLLKGDFHDAELRFAAAAKSASTVGQAPTNAAVRAYFAAAAAGETKAAVAIRKTYSLPTSLLCDDCLVLEKAAGSGKNKGKDTEFKKQGVVDSLIDLTDLAPK